MFINILSLKFSNSIYSIYNKILDRDWFSLGLFVIVSGPSRAQFIMVIELSGVQFGLKSYA